MTPSESPAAGLPTPAELHLRIDSILDGERFEDVQDRWQRFATDLRHHVRREPWKMLGLGFALGFAWGSIRSSRVAAGQGSSIPRQLMNRAAAASATWLVHKAVNAKGRTDEDETLH